MQQHIYYFSGTGNSLHIARELHKRFPESNLIPIINELSLDKIEVKGDSIGFVFPVHAFTIPIPVKKFLQNATFHSASYIFAIATRGGSPCNVFTDMDKLLNKKGRHLDAHFFINMPNNFTHVAKTPTPENISELNREALEKIDIIEEIVSNRKKYKEKAINQPLFRKNILFPILTAFLHKTRYLHTAEKFYADSNCTGCGRCSKACPSYNIEIHEGIPHWKDEAACIFCFACLNYCPLKAIQIRGSKSDVKGRYHHPEVNWNEITMQKSSCPAKYDCHPSE